MTAPEKTDEIIKQSAFLSWSLYATCPHCTETVDLADIDDSDAGWLTLYRGAWSCRPGKVVVRLKHGHEQSPEDVVAVISAVAARMADSPAGRPREQAGQVAVTKANVAFNIAGFALMKHEKELLDPYRIPDA